MPPRKRPDPFTKAYAIGYESSDDLPTTYSPKKNKYEFTDEVTGLVMVKVMLGLPGLKPGDITIDLLHSKLTISGQTTDPEFGDGLNVLCVSRELPRGKFSTVLTVPLGLKMADFIARMEDGLLTVTYPKNAPVQQPERIPVR